MSDAEGRDQVHASGPIFVVGAMRSGSTMLRLVLDSHPAIAIGAETGFMGALLAAKAIPNWRYGAEWYRRLGWTEAELDERLRHFYAGMFGRYAESQGKRRWGDKTPFHTTHMTQMAAIFPDAVFVGIVRHPGAVAASMHKSFNYTFGDSLSYWASTNLDMVRAGAELGDRFVACRYEDLVDEVEPTLRELVDWLGEPWFPGLLEHHRVQRGKGAPRIVDGATSTRDPIDARRAGSWMQTMTPDDGLALSRVSELAAFFGFDPSGRSPLDRPFGPAGAWRWLMSGTQMAHRRDEWADRVDFDQRPKTLAVDASAEELAERLARVEAALARTRSRTSIRLGNAFRKVQRRELREAWALLRGDAR